MDQIALSWSQKLLGVGAGAKSESWSLKFEIRLRYAKTLNHRKILRKTQNCNNLLKTKRILKPK